MSSATARAADDGHRRSAGDPMGGPTLARRLIMAFVLMAVIVCGAGLGAGMVLDRATRPAMQITTWITPSLESNATVREIVIDAQAAADVARATGDATLLEGVQTRYQQAQDQLDLISRLSGPSSVAEPQGGAEVGRLVAAQRRHLAQWHTAQIAPWIRGALPRDASSVAAAADTPRDARADVLGANNELRMWLADRRAALRADAARGRDIGMLGVALATALAMTVVVVIGARAVSWFSRPLREVVEGLDKLRRGDLSARLDPYGPHEVRLVAAAVNHLTDQTALLQALREESTRLRRGTLDGALSAREKIDWHEVVDSGLAAIARTLEVDLAWLHRIEDGALGGCAARWVEPTFGAIVDADRVIAGQPAPVTAEQLAAMWADGLVLAAQNVAWAPAEPGLVDGGHEAFGLGTVIHVPLVAGEDVMGCVALLDTRGARTLSSEEVSALLVMAANTAVGMQHSRMFASQGELVRQLQQLDQQKTMFLSNVSHELRTPLTSIAGYTEMLADGDAGEITEPMSAMLTAISRNTHRLSLLIDDLLTVARIEGPGYRMVTARVSARALVERVVEAIRPELASAALRLDLDLRAPDLAVEGDVGQLERSLLNLCSNAIKFTPAGGVVTISSAEVGAPTDPGETTGWLALRVADTGIGIPPEDQQRLFGRFFRASNAVDNQIPGTGLGLAIVRGIIEHHGGTLSIESAVGEGTTVSLLMPLAPGPADAVDEGDDAGVAAEGPRLALPGQRYAATSSSQAE